MAKPVLLRGGMAEVRTLRQLGCTPIDDSDSGTYSEEAGQENAEKIQDAGDTIADPDTRDRALVIDDRYALADHDSDGIGVLLPEAYGITVYSLGLSDRASYHPTSGAEGGFSDKSAGLFWTGNDDETMMVYPGCSGDLQLRLVGRYCQDSGDLSAALAGARAGEGLIVRNTSTSPPGAKSTITIFGALFEQALVKHDYVDEQNHADNVVYPFIYHRYCKRQLWVRNDQSVNLTIIKSHNDGSVCEALFDFDYGGDLKVVECYAPNGILLRVSSTLTRLAANFEIGQIKLDANFGLSNVRLIECNANLDQNCRIRMSGSLGYNTSPNKQLVVRKEPLVNGTWTQPDIQLDIKELARTEALAYPMRPVKGWAFDSTAEYNTTAVSSTKLWIDPTTLTGYTLSGNGDDGDVITVVADRSTTQTSMAAGGTDLIYRKPGINWRPSLHFYAGGSGGSRLVKTSPVSLDDGPTALTIMGVYQEQQSGYGADSIFCACMNTNVTGGFILYRAASTGLLKFTVGGTTITSDNAFPVGKPVLFIAQWIGGSTSMTLWLDGVQKTGSGASSLSSVNGQLTVGAYQASASPTYTGNMTGKLGDFFIDEANWNISNADTDANNAPLLGSWNSKAVERVNYLRAKWGVF